MARAVQQNDVIELLILVFSKVGWVTIILMIHGIFANPQSVKLKRLPDVYAVRKIRSVMLTQRGGYRRQPIALSAPDSCWSPRQDNRAD